MQKNTLKTIINTIWTAAAMLVIIAAGGLLMQARSDQMRIYEQAHGCKYDYNDLCYTPAERPWLFYKGCATDSECESVYSADDESLYGVEPVEIWGK